MIARCVVFAALCCAGLSVEVATATDEKSPPQFGFDVMAILSKSGCNSGACHGNQNGKGGFKLSLRGEDAAADFATFTSGKEKRIDDKSPEKSLVLQKPTMQIDHEGGLRFETSSVAYQILRDWIAAGAKPNNEQTKRVTQLKVTPDKIILREPENQVQLHVVADCMTANVATTQDVTSNVVYEVLTGPAKVSRDGVLEMPDCGESAILVRFLQRQATVRVAFIPRRVDYQWSGPTPINYIDDNVFAKLKSLRMNPSPLCDDGQFIRRAFLDVLGILPTSEEARTFVNDESRHKRAKLIDAILSRPEYADHWAGKWADLLRVEERTLDVIGVKTFYGWIRKSLDEGMPLDQFVREMIDARGSTYQNPPTNYWRGHRDPITRAESAAEVFLGVRLLCAKCHNHPFERWTQDDYYNWTAFFARVDYKIIKNDRKDKNDSHEFDGEQIVLVAAKGEVENPRYKKSAVPQFLGATSPVSAEAITKDRLEPLGEWLTDKGNEQFAKVQANRIWFNLLGRGIVEPVDDFRASNPACSPELMDALAHDLATHGFDQRHLIRTILLSRTYQLSSEPNFTNRTDELNFSHALARRLTAEQLLDSVNQVLGTSSTFSSYPAGTRAGQVAGVKAKRDKDQPPGDGDRFLRSFGRPPRLLSCECERSNGTTLSQAFQLLSGPALHKQITTADNQVGKWLSDKKPTKAIIDELYWSAFARNPSDDERSALAKYCEIAPDRRAALEDVVWSVLNAKEFLLQH